MNISIMQLQISQGLLIYRDVWISMANGFWIPKSCLIWMFWSYFLTFFIGFLLPCRSCLFLVKLLFILVCHHWDGFWMQPLVWGQQGFTLWSSQVLTLWITKQFFVTFSFQSFVGTIYILNWTCCFICLILQCFILNIFFTVSLSHFCIVFV